MNLSKTEWSQKVRDGKFPNLLCIWCHIDKAVEVTSTNEDFTKPGVIEAAFCASCFNKLGAYFT